MYRTQEEEQEYRKLPREEKKRYDLEVGLDPSLSHKKVMQIIEADKVIHKRMQAGNHNVDVDRPEVQRDILTEVLELLRKNAPSVWRSVKSAFEEAISYLTELIMNGIEFVVDSLLSRLI